MYSSVPSYPWNASTSITSIVRERTSSAQPVSPISPPTATPSSPTTRGRLRGLSYLRSYTHNHILSRENHHHNSSANNQNSRPIISHNASYPSPAASPTSANAPSAVASPATPATENLPRQTSPTAQRFPNTPELSSASSNLQENLGSTSGWLPTVGGRSGVSRIATQPQSTATASSSAVLSANDPSAITSGLEASMARTRSAGTGGAADMPSTNYSGERSPGAAMSHQLPSIRFSPHQDPRAHRPSLVFGTMSRTLPTGNEIIKVGRYSERDAQPLQAANVPNAAPVGFKSKVVSRRHCELWCSGGRWFIKDVKSSSGTFLNHIRLSSPGTESRPFPVNDGDIVQLGIDFKGGEEMIFRCVKIRVELNKGWQTGPSSFNVQSHKRLRELNNIQKTQSAGGSSSQDCSICLGPIAPCQSLFVAPCSHTWHYKCIRVVINGPTWPHFICPNCRTVADLEAELDEPDEDWEELAGSEGEVEAVSESASRAHNTESAAEDIATPTQQANSSTAAPALPEPERFEPLIMHHIDELDSSDDSSTGVPAHEAGLEDLAFLHVNDSPASSASATPAPRSNSNSTVPPVDIVTRKPVPSTSAGSSSRVEHGRGSPSPNGMHRALTDPLTGEGPMTPRNDVGPFIFDGGAGLVNSTR